ncbi:hypothetical protein HDU88_006661 [Geranomyces variabilis]|nr:hypothetical protein HDU88_006661 [Geranomyces variabilis]
MPVTAAQPQPLASTRSILVLIDPTHIPPTAQLHQPLTALLAGTSATLRLAYTSTSSPPTWLPTGRDINNNNNTLAVRTSSSPPTRLAADLALHVSNHKQHVARTDVLILHGRDATTTNNISEQRCEELRELAKEMGCRKALRIDVSGPMQVARFGHAVDAMCAHMRTRVVASTREVERQQKQKQEKEKEDGDGEGNVGGVPGLADWIELALPGLEAISSDEEEEEEESDDEDAQYGDAEDMPWEEFEAMGGFAPSQLDAVLGRAVETLMPAAAPQPSSRQHPATLTNTNTHTCLECGKVFGNARSLGGHKGWHTRKRDDAVAAAVAAARGQSFSAVTPQLSVMQSSQASRRSLRQPALTPSPTRSPTTTTHACLECGKVFANARSLGGHKGWHTRTKNSVAAAARR